MGGSTPTSIYVSQIKEGLKLGREVVGVSAIGWGRSRDTYDQSTLYACVTFSNVNENIICKKKLTAGDELIYFCDYL